MTTSNRWIADPPTGKTKPPISHAITSTTTSTSSSPISRSHHKPRYDRRQRQQGNHEPDNANRVAPPALDPAPFGRYAVPLLLEQVELLGHLVDFFVQPSDQHV